MSRGRFSRRALDAALPVARARGQVMLLRRHPSAPYDFFISTPCGMVAVCTQRSRRLHGALEDIDSRYQETLAIIIAAKIYSGMMREFWLWSPYGSMRFFRIEGSVLTELDRLGVPLSPQVTATVTVTRKSGADEPVKKKINTKSGEKIFPEKIPGTDTGPRPAEVPGPEPAQSLKVEHEPAPIRYLRRRAREQRELKDHADATGKEVVTTGTPGVQNTIVGEEPSPS